MRLGRLLAGLLTGGFSEVFRSIPNHIAAMVQSNKAQEKAIERAFESGDPVKAIGQTAVEASNENSYLGYRTPGSFNPYAIEDGNALYDTLKGWTGSGLTTAELSKMYYQTAERQAAEAYNHNEAVDARMWQQYVEQNKYSWNTQSMQDAGLNPAMMYGGGNLVGTSATGAAGSISPQSAPSGGQGSMSLGDLFGALMTAVRMPLELKSLKEGIRAQKLDNELKAKDVASYDDRIGSDIANKNADTEKKIAELDEIASKIRNNEADTYLKMANASKAQAEEAVEWAKYAQIGLTNELQEQLNPLLVEAQQLENELNRVESAYREKQILANLAEVRAQTAALYAQAALAGAQKEGVDIQNKISGAEARFASTNAQNRANLLKWTAYTNREQLKQAKYQTGNAQYYAEHYEEAFRNSWEQSGTEFGVTKMLGEAVGNAAMLGLMLAL